MKTPFFQTREDNFSEEIDEMLQKEHQKIKEAAYEDGKFNALKNPSQPFVEGDKLIHYIAGYKANYEQLALRVLEKYRPATHLPEGRIDADWAEIQNKRLNDAIKQLMIQKNLLKKELGSFDPSEMASRLRKINWISAGLFVGELALNTQAFQITGDNLISSLILAASVSFTVCLGAHFAGRRYKDAKTKMARRIILLCSAVGITVFSSVVAALRSFWMTKMGIDISPMSFTVFNIAFFAIAALLNWYIHPTKEEMEAHRGKLQKYYQIKKLEKELERKNKELVEHEISSKEASKRHIQQVVCSEYAVEKIKRMYEETVQAFKNGNIQCRKDIPGCFSDPIPPLNIPDINFKSTINKFNNKSHENSDNHLAA